MADVDIFEGPLRPIRGKLSVVIAADCGALQISPSAQLWIINSTANRGITIESRHPIYDLANACTSDASVLTSVSSSAPFGYHQIFMSGEIDTMNVALSTLQYVAPKGTFTGPTAITFDVSDNGK